MGAKSLPNAQDQSDTRARPHFIYQQGWATVLLNITGSLTRKRSAGRRAAAATPPTRACTGPVGTSQVIHEILLFAQIRHRASVGEKARRYFQWAFWWAYMKVTGKVTWMLEKTERWPRTLSSKHWFEDIVSLWSGQTALSPEPLRRKGKTICWFGSVQSLYHVQLCDLMDCSTPGLPVHHQLPESTQTQVHWLSDAIQPSHPLSPPSPPLNLSSIRVFSNESVLSLRWPKYWSFSFSISPSNEYSVLIYFRMDWLDLLAVQGTFKSLLQHHRSKASILRHSAFFKSNSHIHTWHWKTVALTR